MESSYPPRFTIHPLPASPLYRRPKPGATSSSSPSPATNTQQGRGKGRRRMGEFDDYWARAYRGDPAVPHSDPQRLVSTWTGAFALGAAACVHHHASALASHLKSLPATWQDMTLVLDQKRWKKALEKKQQQA